MLSDTATRVRPEYSSAMTHAAELLLLALAGLGCLAAMAAAAALLLRTERQLQQLVGKVQYYDSAIPSYLPSVPPGLQRPTA